MSIGNVHAAELLNLVFNATAIANIADNAATGPLTDIQVSLHYDDPGEAGTQATNEASYASYARVARSRSNASGGWAAATAVDPAAVTPHTTNIDFPESTGAEPNGAGVLDFFATGVAASGATKYLWSGAVSPTITVAGAGVTPRLTTASTITLDASWIATLAVVWLLFKMGVFTWLATLGLIQ